MAYALTDTATWSAVTTPVKTVYPGGHKHYHAFSMVLTGTGTLTVEVQLVPGAGFHTIAGSPFNATTLQQFVGLFNAIQYTPGGLGAGEAIVLNHVSWNEGDGQAKAGNITSTPGLPGYTP